MNSTTWRTALLATGAVLAASSLLVAGCSKGGDMSDSSGSDPNIPASTSASSSPADSAPGAGSGAPMASTDSSSTVSSAGVISPGAGLTNDSSTMSSSPAPAPPPPREATDSTPGRATGPRS